MSEIPVNKLGPYAAASVNKVTNPQIDKFKDELTDEMAHRHALSDIEFLQRVLKDPNLPADKRQATEEMLRDAQRDLAQLQQELNKKYNV